MNRGLLAACAVAASLTLPGCIEGGLGPSLHERVEESRPLSASGHLDLTNTNGSVRVSAWDEPRVRIEAEKSARSRRALEQLQVVIETEGDRVAVRTHQARPGVFGGGGVQYEVRVPRGARVSVSNVNGRVEVDGTGSAVRAVTVNGSLELRDVSGEVEATTTNGGVEVRMLRVDPAGRNRIAATNGSVRLTLPADAAADLEARTVNGSVRCDFDLGPDARVSRRKLEGRIGAGGPRFELRTVNGSATIERGLAASATPAHRQPAEAGVSR